jgi:hypothetical protein
MDIIAGVMLYVLPELDAFYSLRQLVTRAIPMHFSGCSDGAYLACTLVDEVLAAVDPQLQRHLVEQVRHGVIVHVKVGRRSCV